MKSFKEFLTDAYKDNKNTHMTHIEDLVIYGGVNGTRDAIEFLRSMRDMLSGHQSAAIDTTVKWDGAPAIFVGLDPADKRFFIAKKGLFAKTPKIYKSEEDIDADTSGDLAVKLKVAFNELKNVGITNVIQGDMMFTKSDLKTETIDGVKYLTFQPNTIVYAVPVGSELAKTIGKAKMGVVFHTTYTGTDIQSMKASFGANLSSLKSTPSVWMQDASYRDLSGTVSFTSTDSKELTAILSKAGTIFQKIAGSTLRAVEQNVALARMIEQFNNTLVRDGKRIGNTKQHVKNLIAWFDAKFEKEREQRSSEKGKAIVTARQEDLMRFFAPANMANLDLMFQLQNTLVDAKMFIISKLDKIQQTSTFVKTKDGFKVTNPEGYVAIDHTKGAVKLVDRLNFSYLNFSPEIIKGWH